MCNQPWGRETLPDWEKWAKWGAIYYWISGGWRWCHRWSYLCDSCWKHGQFPCKPWQEDEEGDAVFVASDAITWFFLASFLYQLFLVMNESLHPTLLTTFETFSILSFRSWQIGPNRPSPHPHLYFWAVLILQLIYLRTFLTNSL